MDPELQRFEEELERLSPRAMPAGLIARMESVMEGWELGEEGCGKVLPFPDCKRFGRSRRLAGFGMWGAAAGVALLGCLAGLLVGEHGQPEKGAVVEGVPASRALQPVVFDPHAAKRRIVCASDRGVVATRGERPMRLLRVEYIDRVVFRNGNGEEVHVERPVVRYILKPVATD